MGDDDRRQKKNSGRERKEVDNLEAEGDEQAGEPRIPGINERQRAGGRQRASVEEISAWAKAGAPSGSPDRRAGR